MMYADYHFYCLCYKGTNLRECDFDRLSREASAYIDQMTFGRLKNGWPITDNIRLACCAVAEAIHKHNTNTSGFPTGVKSETVDGYSVTYTDLAVRRKDSSLAKLEALNRYLPPFDPLRYAGVDR